MANDTNNGSSEQQTFSIDAGSVLHKMMNEPFGTVLNDDGQLVGINVMQFAHYVKHSYSNLSFVFKDYFHDYFDTHVMRDVRSKLIEGMDDVSVDYVNTLERLVHQSFNGNNALVNKQSCWTATDKALFERNEEWVDRGEPAFLKELNQEWSTIYTNFYGLYDVLPIVTKVKKEGLAAEVAVKADADGMVEINYQDRINGKDVLDVGAFIGDTVVLFRDLFIKSKIYAFEPQAGNYHAMLKQCDAEVKSGRLVPVQVGVGDKEGTMHIAGYQGEVDSTASMVNKYKDNEFAQDVPVITLDSYVKEHNLNVGLIKIDIEGFEFEALKGALETIKSQLPMLVIAIYHSAKEFYEIKPYLESLNLGYKFCIRRSALTNPTAELVLIAYQDK